MKLNSIKIYVLKDPRTYEVRYVGQTAATLPLRLYQHVCFAKAGVGPRDKWIRGLKRQELEPIIELLEHVTGDWQESERYWIQYYKNMGNKLTNGTVGGRGVKKA